MWFKKKAEKKLKPRVLSEKDEAVLEKFLDKLEEFDEHMIEVITAEDDATFQYHLERARIKQREANLIANMFTKKELTKDAKSIIKTKVEITIKQMKKTGL